jgi:hypothetical protein
MTQSSSDTAIDLHPLEISAKMDPLVMIPNTRGTLPALDVLSAY